MDPLVPLMVIGVLLFGLAGYLALRYSRGRLKDELSALTGKRVAQVVPGFVVRVTGRARAAAGLLVAPVSRRPCLAFELMVRQPIQRAGTFPVAHIHESRPFWIEDHTGRAFIDPAEHFSLVLNSGPTGVDTNTDDLPEETRRHLAAYLDDHGLTISGTHGLSLSFLITEGLLEDGEDAAVGGLATLEVDPDGDRASSREPPMRRTLRGSREFPLIVSDDPDLVAGRLAARTETEKAC